MYSALTKIEEIVLRRANGDRDHSSTPYLDIEGNYIYTGQKSKFSNKRADFTNHGRKVPKGRLRHNETHIRCNLSDIDGVFITKSDWERNSALAIDSLDNLIKSINQKKFHHNIKQQRRSELAIQDVEEIQDNILAKINYYQEEIKFLEGKKDQYQKDLEALNRGEIIKNEDLKIAFSRKKRKYNKFDENNNENKEIWLQKHIKSFEQDARELNIAIVHLKNENQEEKIRENLKKELKVYVYDANKGLCQEVSQQEVAQKIQRFKFLSLSKLAERQKKSIARNARYVGRSKIGILSFAASAVSSGLAYSDLRESIDNLHEKIGLTSYPISAIISLSIPILVSDSISGLVWEANNAIKTKSISKLVKLLGVGAAAYFSQRDLAPAIEKNGFSEVNSNIMAANCAIIGASLSSLIIDRAAKPIKRLCKGVIETIKQIRYQRNKVDPDTLQEANADLVFFNQTEQLPPPNHQIQQLLPPSQISVSSLQNVLPSQQQPPSLQR